MVAARFLSVGAVLVAVLGAGLGACTVELTNGPTDGGSEGVGDATTSKDGSLSDGGACEELRHDPHWTYEESEMEGPQNWGTLKTKDGGVAFPECASTTKQQSPIAIPAPASASDSGADGGGALTTGPFKLGAELSWSATSTIKSLHHNGHTWLAGLDRTQNKLTVGTTPYELAQFHFHAPAEHAIGGKEYPLEAHFVHVNPTAGAQPFAAVVGVMFEESETDNAELAKIWTKFDKCPHETPKDVSGISVDLNKLLPEKRTYVQYDGSLTTPPCSVAVRFHIILEPIKASKKQIEALTQAVGRNDRPHQPVLGGTSVSLHAATPL